MTISPLIDPTASGWWLTQAGTIAYPATGLTQAREPRFRNHQLRGARAESGAVADTLQIELCSSS